MIKSPRLSSLLRLILAFVLGPIGPGLLILALSTIASHPLLGAAVIFASAKASYLAAIFVLLPVYLLLTRRCFTNPAWYLGVGAIIGVLVAYLLNIDPAIIVPGPTDNYGWYSHIPVSGGEVTFFVIWGAVSAVSFWLIARPDRSQMQTLIRTTPREQKTIAALIAVITALSLIIPAAQRNIRARSSASEFQAAASAQMPLAAPIIVTAKSSNHHFCLLPVDSSILSDSDGLSHSYLSPQSIPGLPSPVAERWGTIDPMWIDDHRRLVRLADSFAGNLYGQVWVREPWSSRIVAANGPVAVMAPQDHGFKIIVPWSPRTIYRSPLLLTNRRQTIVQGNYGMPYVVEAHDLMPLLSDAEWAQHQIKEVSFIGYSNSISATIILDSDRNLHVLTDDNVMEDLGKFTGTDEEIELDDDSSIQAAVVRSRDSALTIYRGNQHPEISENLLDRLLQKPQSLFSTKQVIRYSWFSGYSDLAYLKIFSQTLLYSDSSTGDNWSVLTSNGFKPITGSATGSLVGRDPLPAVSVRELPSIHLDVFPTNDGWFSYDGKRFLPLTSAQQLTHEYFQDIPAINRVFVSSDQGLFELTPERKFVPLIMPFPAPKYGAWFYNWPEEKSIIAQTNQGLFIIDSHLNATPVAGPEIFRPLGFLSVWGPYAPLHGEVIQYDNKIFILVDTALAGPTACPTQP